jgi:hypothetical protein
MVGRLAHQGVCFADFGPDRDPVDAVNDAELLAMVLGHRADQITATARAALDARDVIKRAQNNGG